MNKCSLLFAVLFSFIAAQVSAQECLPEGIRFRNQEQVDSFPINFPGCTHILGDVSIKSAFSLLGLQGVTAIDGNLTLEFNTFLQDLSGLSGLASVGGNLDIILNPSLENLSGLDNLTSVGGYLRVANNSVLTSLSSLNNLSSVGGYLSIYDNYILPRLSGLDNLTFVGDYLAVNSNPALTSLNSLEGLSSLSGYLSIVGNPSLTDLRGLDNLSSVGGYLTVIDNEGLTSLSGLDNLSSVGGYLHITTNPSLASLGGLDNLTSVGDGLTILSNDNLASLSALGNLSAIGGSLTLSGDILTSLSGLDNIGPATITYIFMENSPNLSMCDVPSICNYLSVPDNPAVIGNNASGCSTQGEILDACQASTGTASQTGIAVQVYPNPTRGRVEAAGLKEGQVEVLNNLGQKVMGTALSEAGIDLSELPAGIYFIKIRSGNRWGTERVVKE